MLIINCVVLFFSILPNDPLDQIAQLFPIEHQREFRDTRDAWLSDTLSWVRRHPDQKIWFYDVHTFSMPDSGTSVRRFSNLSDLKRMNRQDLIAFVSYDFLDYKKYQEDVAQLLREYKVLKVYENSMSSHTIHLGNFDEKDRPRSNPRIIILSPGEITTAPRKASTNTKGRMLE